MNKKKSMLNFADYLWYQLVQVSFVISIQHIAYIISSFL